MFEGILDRNVCFNIPGRKFYFLTEGLKIGLEEVRWIVDGWLIRASMLDTRSVNDVSW